MSLSGKHLNVAPVQLLQTSEITYSHLCEARQTPETNIPIHPGQNKKHSRSACLFLCAAADATAK
jgi:hypothetical protein